MSSLRGVKHDLDILIVRLGVFIVASAFFAISLSTAPIVQADHQAWRIWPAIEENGRWEYGWHFDEYGPSGLEPFGARDFNHLDDGDGMLVWLRLEAWQDLPFPMRYLRDFNDDECGMQAQLQAWSGSWFTITGTELRYIHLDNIATGITSVFQFDEDEVTALAGVIETDNPECMVGDPHVHQSARLFANFYEPQVWTNDTCWIDDEDDTGQCGIGDEDNYSRAHDDCPHDYVTAGAPYDKSGEISGEYVCEEWSADPHGNHSTVFYAKRWW